MAILNLKKRRDLFFLETDDPVEKYIESLSRKAPGSKKFASKLAALSNEPGFFLNQGFEERNFLLEDE